MHALMRETQGYFKSGASNNTFRRRDAAAKLPYIRESSRYNINFNTLFKDTLLMGDNPDITEEWA